MKRIAELAREDRRERPVRHRDRIEEAPEFSMQDIPSEAESVDRLPYQPREYHAPVAERIAVNAGEEAATTVQSAADLLYAIAAVVREKPFRRGFKRQRDVFCRTQCPS